MIYFYGVLQTLSMKPSAVFSLLYTFQLPQQLAAPSLFSKSLIAAFLLQLPLLAISQVKIDSINGTAWTDKQTAYLLAATQDILEIKFKSISFTDTPTVYLYKLAGVDKGFISTISPKVRYTFLKGGEYTFYYAVQAKGKKLDYQKIQIRVEEEIQETWWFYPSLIFYTVLILGAIVYFWAIYNLRQNLKMQLIRNRIASDLHDEIGSSLSSIKLDIEKIQTQLDEPQTFLRAALEEVRQTADEIITNLRDTVWTIKTDNDDFLRLVERIKSTASKLLRNRGIELEFASDLSEKNNFKIGMDQRRNVFLIFKEALHNTIKYAEAQQVKIKFSPSNHDWIEMKIDDNGKGFDKLVPRDGNGLYNFETRSAESFFKFSLDTAPGKGTHIRVLIPKL